MGRTIPGKIVTRARGGQSLHNYQINKETGNPEALAFDITFIDSEGEIHWEEFYFKRFAAIIKPLGVHWGGDQISFVDTPHYDVPDFTWHDCVAGKYFDLT